MERAGKLIVIEGTDGSGKATQTRLLLERLKREGFKVATLSLPQYGAKSAGPTEEYLTGKYGKPDEVSPYAASLLFAADHFDAALRIREFLAEGFTVVMDRYVDSNAGHQGGKIKDEESREEFLEWLYDLEYAILGIPKPDLVIVLHVPAQIAQGLALKRGEKAGKKADAHEADLEHLLSAQAAYLYLVKQFPLDHKMVECFRGGLLHPEKIHDKVWEIVEPIVRS